MFSKKFLTDTLEEILKVFPMKFIKRMILMLANQSTNFEDIVIIAMALSTSISSLYRVLSFPIIGFNFGSSSVLFL